MVATLFLALGLVQIPKAPQLKQVLPNDAVAFVQRFENAKTVSVHLLGSFDGLPQSADTHGRTHLLEHILAKGPGKSLDKFLEIRGLVLIATTSRGAMDISISGPPSQLSSALEAVRRLLTPVETTPEEIAKEVNIIEEEAALASWSTRLSRSAWVAAYGEAGQDPVGNPDAMRKTTPGDLVAVQKVVFAPPGLVVTVCGPVDIDAVMKELQSLLAPVPRASVKKATKPMFTAPTAPTTADAYGEARGAKVEGLGDAAAMATVAAGMALESLLGDAKVIYTPSGRPGLVVLSSSSPDTLGKIDELTETEKSNLFSTGRNLVSAWLNVETCDPGRAGRFWGLILLSNNSATPDTWAAEAKRMSYSQFSAGLRRFGRGEAVVVEGTR